MEEINIKITKEDLLVITGALIKLQVLKGVKDDKMLDLSAKLMTQVLDNLTAEEISEFRKNI